MNAGRKKSSKKVSRRVNKKAVKRDSKVTFKAFFSRCIVLGQLKPWQEKEIYTFFRAQDLKDKEDLDVYQKILEKY